MIKFFRIIRQNLVSENKFSKYIIYAIGEIVLVVIGILIALQINNWNEQQKANKLEQEYYCRLLDDTIQDINQLDRKIESVQIRLKSANNAVRLLNKSKVYKVEIGKAIAGSIAGIMSDFTPNTSALEDLKSGANLNIIRDKSIIKSVNNYLANIEASLIIIKVNGEIALDRFNSYTDLFANGYIHFSKQGDRFKNYMDKDVYEMVSVDNDDTLNSTTQFQLLNDALRYISSNARQMQLFLDMKKEAIQLKDLLELKCPNSDAEIL